jgi:hypothetical protein
MIHNLTLCCDFVLYSVDEKCTGSATCETTLSIYLRRKFLLTLTVERYYRILRTKKKKKKSADILEQSGEMKHDICSPISVLTPHNVITERDVR